jgi:hypothetical protein
MKPSPYNRGVVSALHRPADPGGRLFAGHDPADLLHSLVSTGLPAQALSGAYMVFFVFIPVSLELLSAGRVPAPSPSPA